MRPDQAMTPGSKSLLNAGESPQVFDTELVQLSRGHGLADPLRDPPSGLNGRLDFRISWIAHGQAFGDPNRPPARERICRDRRRAPGVGREVVMRQLLECPWREALEGSQRLDDALFECPLGEVVQPGPHDVHRLGRSRGGEDGSFQR
jgi:hypothetical protein